jgi:hypothetical protein
MNIRLLKKLRKRYKYYWLDENPTGKSLRVLNNRDLCAHFYDDVPEFLTDYLFWTYGFGAADNYKKRLANRHHRIEFYRFMPKNK